MISVPTLARIVVAYIAIFSCTTICLMWFTGQNIPDLLGVMFLGSIGELGIDLGIGKMRKK